MKLSLFTTLLVGATTTLSSNAFVPTASRSSSVSSKSTSMDASYLDDLEASAPTFVKPGRVIFDQLPTLYVYDHCPFCVRVRIAFGVKNIKHSLHFMANDDIPLPTSLVGKKIAPIFNFPADGITMAESLDIIHLIDTDPRFGPTNVIKPASGRTDLKAWQKSVQTLLRTLQRPRYVATGLLPEFQQLDSRHAFIKNHQLPPYEKPEWKNEMNDMDEKLKIYADAMSSDPTAMVGELSAKLIELDDMIFSEYSCTEGGLSLDDIDLWARLRSTTIIKGVQWPQKLRNYMDNFSELADIPLYDEMAM